MRIAAARSSPSNWCRWAHHAGLAARADEWDAVVAAAKKEGAVTVYHAQLGAPHWKKVVQDFEAKYGIKVGEFDARASEMNERIRDTTEVCFICGIDKQVFDRAANDPDGFKIHIRQQNRLS